MPMNREQYSQEQQMRAELETGFTDQEWAVGMVICPARDKCPNGIRGLFRPLKNGRLPMHRNYFGDACAGARQKPTTPPMQLKPATPAP